MLEHELLPATAISLNTLILNVRLYVFLGSRWSHIFHLSVVSKEIAEHVGGATSNVLISFHLGRRDGKVLRRSYRRKIGWADEYAHTKISL